MLNQSSSALGTTTPRVDSFPLSEYPVRFRFRVTWSYITTPVSAPAAKTQLATRPVSSPAPPVKPASAAPPAPPRSEAQWEMVIPKMARPVAQRPSVPAIAARAAKPQSDTVIGAAFSFYTLQESFVPRRWKLLIFGAATAVAIGLIAWVRPTGSPTSVGPAATQGTGVWSRRTAYLIGSRDPREIVVYDASNGLENYRMEFAWTPDATGVGWIFRGQNSANYYAARIRLLQGGVTPALSVEHFTVVNGVETPHSHKVTTLTKASGPVPVRLDAGGPTFTLYVGGSPVESWNDSRFSTGSLGFYEDHGERPAVQSLRFTFQKKGGTQTVLAALE